MMTKVTELYYKFKILSWLKRKANPLELSGNKPRCFVFLAADYGNLGDVAITYAQEKYLKEKYPGYDIIDVPISQSLAAIPQVKREIRPKDIVTVVGGGNMGDMYFDIELLRLMIVNAFPHNKIILFPQTIDYSDSKEAKALKSRAQKVYCSHPDLIMTAREKTSFETMNVLFPGVDVRLTKDIVLTLNKKEPKRNREGVIFCLRNDKEKAQNERLINEIETYCKENGLNITYRDTHIGRGNLTLDQRNAELNEIWEAFRRSELVITDRLHGMIFAYITGTPALVLPNNNFKIEGCYEWIKDCDYITLAGKLNPTDLSEVLHALPSNSQSSKQ